MLVVFVYGTLKPGGRYYRQLCAGKVECEIPAIAQGRLYDLPLGYPAMVSGSGWVQGYRLQFTDSDMLRVLDQLEDYDADREPAQNAYDRRWVDIFTPEHQLLGQAWAYFMTLEQVQSLGGTHLPNGYWTLR